MQNKICTIAIAGCGARGFHSYGVLQSKYPDKMKIVAVADPIAERVVRAGDTFDVPQENRFDSVESMLKADKLADAMFICTQDRQHVSQAIAAMKKGYHILLEKPVSPSLDECREIVKVCKETGRKVIVCHVLRYTVLYDTLKEMLDNGTIGDIVTVQHIEQVAYWHQAHSFVRGNWRRDDETSPMILAKCCHDADLLLWLIGKHCRSVSSYGSTYLFKEDKAPEGSTERCTDDCKVKENCPYNAEYFYLKSKKAGAENGHRGWPTSVLALDPTPENVLKALQTGPYGRCVYRCDNNVVDHQVVNMDLEDGVTCQFTMTAFTAGGGRETRIMGTHGEIIAKEREILVMPFGKEAYTIDVTKLTDDFSGHGGGDVRMIEEFLDIVSGRAESSARTTSLEDSVESHFVCLAAERSRVENGRNVTLAEMGFELG